MPCIKKKLKTPIIEEEPDDIVQQLKDNFTLEDFLSCDKTRKILEQDWYNEFTYKIENQIEEFYENERGYFREDISTLFYYDTCGSFVSHLTSLLFKHIEPKYDLEIFYENPCLAKPLIEKMENIKEEKALLHKAKLKKNYEENANNQGKTFNWSAKTYK
jgi:hypothetical protein